VIVLSAVLVVYLEILLLGRIKKTWRSLCVISTEKAVTPPPFWHVVGRFRGLLVAVLLVILAVAALAYGNRPGRRIGMIKEVAWAARDAGNVDEAQRAIEMILRVTPGDEDWLLERVRILLIAERYGDVLAKLDDVPGTSQQIVIEKNILRAYALMALKRIEEAGDIVRILPADVKRTNPRVAMILAEMGLHADDPEEVAGNVPAASRWTPNSERVRALYPYLRHHRKWLVISDTHTRGPYRNATQAFSAVEAHMNLGRTAKVAGITLRAMRAWPDDPRLLEPLFYMAVKRIESKWEDRFADHLRRVVHRSRDPGFLYGLFDKCFELARPDLAWLVHRRISELDGNHPTLLMSVVKYADLWFVFRRRFLGLSAASAGERVDLRPLYHFGRSIGRWRGVCEQVPFGEELALGNTATTKKMLLKRAVEEFRNRQVEGRLSLDMQYELVRALEEDGDLEGARQVLAEIAQSHPGDADRGRVVLSEIYDRKEDWHQVYETLRGYLDSDRPDLSPILRLCRAELKLGLGLMALHTATEAVRLFPHSGEAAAMQAEALLKFDSAEEALFALKRPLVRRHRSADLVEAQALYESERFSEFRTFCRVNLLPQKGVRPNIRQHLLLAPAELPLLWHLVAVPSEKEFARNALALRRDLETTTSPFLRQVIWLWLESYENHCRGQLAEPERWTATGRDRIEKATALNQLTFLLCREQAFTKARNVAGVAVKLYPESHLLWRILISLSGGDKEVIRGARRLCPADPEIWLAELVMRTRDARDRQRAAEESARRPVPAIDTGARWSEDAVSERLASILSADRPVFSAAAMARAAEYLLRKGMPNAACMAARDAGARARGLLPASIIGVRCAIIERNRDWALTATRDAIDASQQPLPFLYEKLVALKTVDGQMAIDGDMVEALKNLRRDAPRDPLWAEMLGYIRFQRGGWEIMEAASQMIDAMQAGSTNRIVYVVAGEASRILGNTERAADILRRGVDQHPDDIGLLNNLVYVLALTPEGLPLAQTLLPDLLDRGRDNSHVLDTATVVLLKSETPDKAAPMAAEVRRKTEPGSRLWFRAGKHLAEIYLKTDRPREALAEIEQVLEHTRTIPDEDVLAAGSLLTRIKARLAEAEKDDTS
jgi:predicted Zn-dependent protease